DEEQVVLFLRRGDGDDVGMADAGQEPRLAPQLAEIESLPVGNLDRDLLVDPGVLCQIHGAEPTAAERRDDFVFPEYLTSEEQRAQYTLSFAVRGSRFAVRGLAVRPATMLGATLS